MLIGRMMIQNAILLSGVKLLLPPPSFGSRAFMAIGAEKTQGKSGTTTEQMLHYFSSFPSSRRAGCYKGISGIVSKTGQLLHCNSPHTRTSEQKQDRSRNRTSMFSNA